MPLLRIFGSKIVVKNEGISLRWPSNVLIFCVQINTYLFMYLEQLKHVLDECDHRNQQNPPYSKLHIELLEQFEGSRTSTNFIEPLLPNKRTEQPCDVRICRVGQNHVYERCIYGDFGREITKYTVIYSVYIRSLLFLFIQLSVGLWLV